MIKLNTFALSDSQLKKLLKKVYPHVNRYSLNTQNSIVMNGLPREKWEGGESVNFSLANGSMDTGNDAAALYNGSVAGVTSYGTTGITDLNDEISVSQSMITGQFKIDTSEVLLTQSGQGAYERALSDRMFKAYNGLNKRLGLHFYNGNTGSIGEVKTGLATGAGSFNVKAGSQQHNYLTEGTKFIFRDGSAWGTKKSGVHVVQNVVSDQTHPGVMTVNFEPALAVDIDTGDYICAAFGDDITRSPDGLADIIPSWFGRTGTPWQTYISNPFRGMNRSRNEWLTAGKYFHYDANQPDFKWSELLDQALINVQNAGATPENLCIAVSPLVMGEIQKELRSYGVTNIYRGSDSNIELGYKRIASTIGDMAENYLIRDPAAPMARIYGIPKGDHGMKLWDMGEISGFMKNQNQTGKLLPGDVGTMGLSDSPMLKGMNFDKLFDVTAGGIGTNGPQAAVFCHFFGNFIMQSLDQGFVIDIDLPTAMVDGVDIW